MTLYGIFNSGSVLYDPSYVRYAYKNYMHQLKNGIEEPMWNKEIDITTINLSNIDDATLK